MKDRIQFETVSRAQPAGLTRVLGSRDPNPDVAAVSFRKLRRVLTQDRLRSVERLDHAAQVKQAATEASSLSWLTGYPLLVFPVLFEECATTALYRARRQDQIHQRSRELLASIQSDSAG